MSADQNDQFVRLLQIIVPAGLVLAVGYYLDSRSSEVHTDSHVSGNLGREPQFLRYNKDEIFKGFLSTEGHLRNVESKEKGGDGFLNCAVKHLADVESHEDEAISHSLVAENEKMSEGYRHLRDETRDLRHELQDGKVSASQGIIRVRQIRYSFEQMNPEYDVSKCSACSLESQGLSA